MPLWLTWPMLLTAAGLVAAATAVRLGLQSLGEKVVAHERREEADAVKARTEAAAAAAAAMADRSALAAMWQRGMDALAAEWRRDFQAMGNDLKDLRFAVAEGSTELGRLEERIDGLRRELDEGKRERAELRKDLDNRSLRRATDAP